MSKTCKLKGEYSKKGDLDFWPDDNWNMWTGKLRGVWLRRATQKKSMALWTGAA